MQVQYSYELADVLDAEFRIAVDALSALNYAETGPTAQGLMLKMDWEALERAQSLGAMFVVVARTPQDVVGYAVVWLARHPTYCGQTVAQCSALFVESEARRSGAGLSLIRKMTEEAKERGAELFLMGCPRGGRADSLFSSLGWEAVETLYAKTLR